MYSPCAFLMGLAEPQFEFTLQLRLPPRETSRLRLDLDLGPSRPSGSRSDIVWPPAHCVAAWSKPSPESKNQAPGPNAMLPRGALKPMMPKSTLALGIPKF